MAELISEGRVVSHTEKHGEQQGQAEAGEQEEAVGEQEQVKQLLLHPDHPDLQCVVLLGLSLTTLHSLYTAGLQHCRAQPSHNCFIIILCWIKSGLSPLTHTVSLQLQRGL